mmetsp:Transcript_35502/g.85656  ORF Transcript_35502/g.85656 Transcript_35502/m.85656 type:complete len:352 (-) Transcript_35502:809-1864(-)
MQLNLVLDEVANVTQAVDLLLALFNLVEDFVPVSDTSVVGPERDIVLLNVLFILASFLGNIIDNLVDGIATVRLERVAKHPVVLFRPICKSLGQQLVLLGLLRLCQSELVQHSLHLLHFLLHRQHLGSRSHCEPFPQIRNHRQVVFLLLRQFPLAGRKLLQSFAIVELEVLHVWPLLLFLGLGIGGVGFHVPAGHVPAGRRLAHLFLVILVDVILCTFAFPRAHVNEQGAIRPLIPVILAGKVKRVLCVLALQIAKQAERGEVVLRVLLKVGLHFVRLLLALGDEGINVLICVCALLTRDDLIRAEFYHMHEFFLAQLGILLGQPSLLDDSGVQEKLLVGPLNDLLLNSAL